MRLGTRLPCAAAGVLLAAAVGCAGAGPTTGFAEPVTVEALGRINAIVIAELSGDGRPDIAALNGEPGRLLVLLNQGKGRFVPAPGGELAVTPPASGLVAGDFDGDGRQDLVVASHDSDAVAVLLGRGDGTLETARSVTLVSRQGGTPHVHDLDGGDFNGDGVLDLVLAQSEDDAIVLALGDGRGGFSPAGAPVRVGQQPYRVVAADFDGDGALDVAAPNARSSDLTVTLGDGRGGLARVEGPATALQ